MDWRTHPSEVPPHLLKAWKEEEEALRRYEDPGSFGLSVASIRELTDRTPEKIDLLTDRMAEEEPSPYEAWLES